MDDQRPPDALERGIRFGCGFAAGALIALAVVVSEWTLPVGREWGWVGVAAVAAGFLAMLLGDRFWHVLGVWVRDWF